MPRDGQIRHVINTVNFVDQYYEYDGEEDAENKGLTTGGYESAWFADLAGAYVLENT
jgi:hypothetical protein